MLDPLRLINKFHEDGQILGKTDDGRRMDFAVRAEARDALEDGRPRQPFPFRHHHQRFIQRSVMPLIEITDINAHSERIANGCHRSPPRSSVLGPRYRERAGYTGMVLPYRQWECRGSRYRTIRTEQDACSL